MKQIQARNSARIAPSIIDPGQLAEIILMRLTMPAARVRPYPFRDIVPGGEFRFGSKGDHRRPRQNRPLSWDEAVVPCRHFSAEGDFMPRPPAYPLRADSLTDPSFGRLIAEAVEEVPGTRILETMIQGSGQNRINVTSCTACWNDSCAKSVGSDFFNSLSHFRTLVLSARWITGSCQLVQ